MNSLSWNYCKEVTGTRERERERFCWKPHRTEGKSPGCEMYICRIVIQIRSVCRGKFPPVKGTGQQHAESLFIARSCNCLQARFPSARRGSDRCENVRGLKMRVEGIRRSKLHPPVHALPQSWVSLSLSLQCLHALHWPPNAGVFYYWPADSLSLLAYDVNISCT